MARDNLIRIARPFMRGKQSTGQSWLVALILIGCWDGGNSTVLLKRMIASPLHLKAIAQKALGRADEAILTYQRLLSRQPGQAVWRYELAQLLREQGQLEESRRELVVVLARQPNHYGARELLGRLKKDIAGRR
jgi:tetratricopeptide (TPR) repeat protein